MWPQRKQPYRAVPLAHANYDRLCRHHGTIPTTVDVDAIRRTIGNVGDHSSMRSTFGVAMLFFLRRSAVRFEENSLLIGWVIGDDRQTRQEVWFRSGKVSLHRHPGNSHALSRGRGGSACDEWHPVIFDIVDPNVNQNRIVQFPYLRACVKILQTTVPPPSIENPRLASTAPASTHSAKPNVSGSSSRTSNTPPVFSTPGGRLSSSTVDLTGSDEEAIIKPEVTSDSTRINHTQAPSAQVEEKIQVFRSKLENKEVEELQQMLEKQLPSWIKKLAEDVLQKKMLDELELAESFL